MGQMQITGIARQLLREIGGDEDICDRFSVSLFSDKATVDNNMVSLRHALNRVGSQRVAQLRTTEKDDSDWSLYLVNRHEVRTSCIILPE